MPFLSRRTTPRPIPQIARHPARRVRRVAMLLPTGPNQPCRRPTHGKAISATAPTRSRTRSVAPSTSVAGTFVQLRHSAQAPIATSPPIPAQYTNLRITRASFTTSHNPPAIQSSLGHPPGSWPASACTASAQSRRSGGSNCAITRRAQLSERLSRSITSPPPRAVAAGKTVGEPEAAAVPASVLPQLAQTPAPWRQAPLLRSPARRWSAGTGAAGAVRQAARPPRSHRRRPGRRA
jgi:hypothetical protein